jgi:ligand-binding SRPBCC domain-containing protein
VARYELHFESELSVPPERAWEWATSVKGIRTELRPLCDMTAPAGLSSLNDVEVELGKPLGKSWVLLFGVLPIDVSRITLVELEPGHRFLERSPMLSMKLWQHERIVEPTSRGSKLCDNLTFEPRFAGPLVLRLITAFFRNRHRVLRRELG